MGDGGKLRPDTLQVRFEKCESCIFVAKYPLATRHRIFTDIGSEGSIACHQYLQGEDDDVYSEVMCRGFYDRDPYHNTYMRLSAMLGKVEFVDEDGEPIACPIPQTDAQVNYSARRKRLQSPRVRARDTRTLENISDV